MTTITIGTDGSISPFGGYLLTDTNLSILPEYDEYADTAPGYAGRYLFGQDPREREITIVFRVYKVMSQQAAFLRTLAGYLNPANGKHILKDGNDNNKQLQCAYAGGASYTRKFDTMIFTVPLIGDPYWESQGTHVLANSGTAANVGNVPCPCLIKLLGAATNPSIAIAGVTVSYTGTIAAGNRVEVDTRVKTAKHITGAGVATNVLDKVNGNFPWLKVDNNTVATSFSTQISWQDWWL